MPNNLHISYDLNSPGQNYDRLIEGIKALGTWAKIHKSYWYLSSNHTAQEVAEHLWKLMDDSDSLYVVDASNNSASWFNIPEGNTEFIQEHWHAMA
jgi:hypothetical protein